MRQQLRTFYSYHVTGTDSGAVTDRFVPVQHGLTASISELNKSRHISRGEEQVVVVQNWLSVCSLFPLSVSLSLAVFLSLSLIMFLCICLSLSLYLSLSVSLCLSLSLYLSLCFYLSLYLSLYLCLSVSVSISLCVFLSVSVSLCLSVSVSLCLSVSVCLCLCLFLSPNRLSFFFHKKVNQNTEFRISLAQSKGRSRSCRTCNF